MKLRRDRLERCFAFSFVAAFGIYVLWKAGWRETEVVVASESLCDLCNQYPDIGVDTLRKCKVCFDKVVDESPEANERNRLLIEYYKRAKTAKTREQRLPDIVGIGVRKCGTSWLQFALRRHPMIKTNREEGHFFNLRKNFEKGVQYYRSIMPNVSEYELAMEKTPGYFNYARWRGHIPSLMKSYLPSAKLWLILCDPAQRALSDFVHVTLRKETPLPNTLDEYVDKFLPQAAEILLQETDFNKASLLWGRSDTASKILTLGVYYPMMAEWLKFHNTDHLHIISGEDMVRDPGKVVEKLQEFLGIPKMLLSEDFVQNHTSGLHCVSPSVVIESEVYKIPMQCMNATEKGRTRSYSFRNNSSPDEPLKKLKAFFKPHDDKLFRLLGRKLW